MKQELLLVKLNISKEVILLRSVALTLLDMLLLNINQAKVVEDFSKLVAFLVLLPSSIYRKS